MEIVGENDKSTFMIYHDHTRSMWFKYEEEYPSYRQKKLGEKVVPRANIIFSAHIIPISYATTRSGGSVMMKDIYDGTVYRMTQKSLHGLLMALLLGEAEISDGCFSGLFTFRAISDELATDIYTGHFSKSLLEKFRGG